MKKIQIDRNPNSNEREQIATFDRRCQEFILNYNDLTSNNWGKHFRFEYTDQNRVSWGGGYPINRFRLKGFLADYRHFEGQKEPANFLRMINTIKSLCRSQEKSLAILDRLKNDWNNAGDLIFAGKEKFCADAVFSAMFNEEIFHTYQNASVPKLRITDISRIFEEDAIWGLLGMLAGMRCHQVDHLNKFLKPIRLGETSIVFPEAWL